MGSPQSAWGTPVDETQAAAPAAWGTPVDEGDSTQSSALQPATPSLRDQWMARVNDPALTPHPQGTFRGSVERAVQGGMQGLSQAVLHPVDTLGSMAEATPAGSVFDLATGRPNASQQQAQGLVTGMRTDPARTLGQVAGGMAAGALLPAAADVGMDMAGGVRNLRPAPSPSIVPPEEMAARNLTNAINPAPQRAGQYIQAAQKEVPNVIDYAKRTGNPLNTQLEFAKAAEGNAKEARTHYEDNILGPNATETVPAPSGYGGRSIPSGENTQNRATTLGDIDSRIVDINKELDKPRLNASDQRTALASEAELQAEKSQLTDILHRSLANFTGLQPEDIANLRQRVGRSYELANDTNAAVTGRGLQEGKPGSLVHGLGMGQLAMKAADIARGGPTAIADRSFQRAIANFPGQAEPLPQPTGPVPAAAAAPKPRPVMPRPDPVEIPIVNTGDPTAQFDVRNNNVQTYQNMQAAEQAAADQQRNAALDATHQAENNYATRGTRLTTLAEQKGVPHAATGSPKAGDVKYANGKAFAYNPETGWWHPQ